MINEILLRRKNMFILPETNSFASNSTKLLATLMANIESLGYTFSTETVKKMMHRTIESLTTIEASLVPVLKELVGANRVYKPFYPNFPETVMTASDASLYINAILHYLTFGEYRPTNDVKLSLHPELCEKHELTVLEGVTSDVAEEKLTEIFTNLCQSKTSLSQTDVKDIIEIYQAYDSVAESLSSLNFPFKENKAIIASIQYNHMPVKNLNTPFIQRLYKKATATDILRLITALSDGDVSLATNTHYRNFSRPERLQLLLMLSRCENLAKDMMTYKNRWIRIGERLHPFEKCYEKRKELDEVIVAFELIRSNCKIDGKKYQLYSDNQQVEIMSKAILSHRSVAIDYILVVLRNNPGLFARKLDFLLRNCNKEEDDVLHVINEFENVSEKISVPVLLQVYAHFLHRNDEINDSRVFFPKGQMAKCWYTKNDLPPIDFKYCNQVVAICKTAIVNIFDAQKPHDMGKVYLSDKFKNYLIPSSQRSASKALKPVTRGSRLPIDPNTKVLRSFIWWTNTENESCVDLDLSAVMYDENMNYINSLYYGNLRNGISSYHSGDITNGGPFNGDGVAEFIDIDLNIPKSSNVRYIAFTVNSYRGQHFSALGGHAMFGWMDRNDPLKGKVFEPSTVKQKFDLTQDTAISIPAIFDIVKMEYVWCDINGNVSARSNCRTALNQITGLCYALCNMHKATLYDLIEMNIKAREGVLVDNIKDADIVFDEGPSADVTPFDIDTIIGNYL